MTAACDKITTLGLHQILHSLPTSPSLGAGVQIVVPAVMVTVTMYENIFSECLQHGETNLNNHVHKSQDTI